MTVLRSFDESLPMALLKARENAMRVFRPVLASHDLTEQQWRVLRALAAADDALDVGDIAEATFLLGPSLTRILGNLEGRGMLSRATSPADQRRSILELTDAGRQLVAEVSPHSEGGYERIEHEFGRTRLLTLISELRDFAQLPLHSDTDDGETR